MSRLEKVLGQRNVLRLMVLQKRMFLTGKQRAEIVSRKTFYAQFIKQGDLCFDVGANTGNRIAPFLAIGARVVAIEPQKDLCQFLKKLFGNKIVIVKAGCGETECVKDFYVGAINSLSSFSPEWIESVTKTSRFKDHSWNKTIKTEITTLDKLIEKYGVPNFIKIDVEGYELEVLKGLTQPVGMLSFEYTVPEHTPKILDCIREIARRNKDVECNYSIGETMTFALQQWISPEKLIELVQTKQFSDTDAGDIYVKRIF